MIRARGTLILTAEALPLTRRPLQRVGSAASPWKSEALVFLLTRIGLVFSKMHSGCSQNVSGEPARFQYKQPVAGTRETALDSTTLGLQWKTAFRPFGKAWLHWAGIFGFPPRAIPPRLQFSTQPDRDFYLIFYQRICLRFLLS